MYHRCMSYALLQLSLDQTIERQAMEEASMAVPRVARADCARLQRELFGIVVDNLDLDCATAFQTSLRRFGFETELIDQSLLPKLPMASGGLSFRIETESFVVTDLYGRETRYGWPMFVYGAGGWVKRLRTRTVTQGAWRVPTSSRHAVPESYVPKVTRETRSELEFQIELFFSVQPYRLQWKLATDSMLNANGQVLRSRDVPVLIGLLRRLQFLPHDRLNTGIRQSFHDVAFEYPSVQAFEEEIVWSFFQLTRPDR